MTDHPTSTDNSDSQPDPVAALAGTLSSLLSQLATLKPESASDGIDPSRWYSSKSACAALDLGRNKRQRIQNRLRQRPYGFDKGLIVDGENWLVRGDQLLLAAFEEFGENPRIPNNAR